MQYIIDKTIELNEVNYPISILMNDRADMILINAKSKIILACPLMKWELNPNELLQIMQTQNTVVPFNVVTEQ